MGTNTTVGPSHAFALFGLVRRAVLRILFSNPGERFYQRRIIQMAGLGSGAVQRELARLTSGGILNRTVEGRQTYFEVNSKCPVYAELRGLVRKTFGIGHVLADALRPIGASVRIAFVYGSIAEGTETAASDIDVMVIGDKPSFESVVAALTKAQAELGREVNPAVYDVHEFRRKLGEGHHFLTSVVKRPRLFLVGDEVELGGLAKERLAQRAQVKPPRNRRPARSGGSRSRRITN